MSEFDPPSVPPLSPPPLTTPPDATPPPPPASAPEVGADTDESPAADPFESWPAAASSGVIEEAPPETSVEHVRGEVEVPNGFTVLEGTPLGHRRSVGVVVSRFNGGVTNRMLQ